MGCTAARVRNELGTVLVTALMVTALLGTLGAALAFVVMTESAVAANYRAGQQGLYAADAGIERAIGDLRSLTSWRTVPGAGGTSATDFNDGAIAPRAGDSTVLDLVRLTSRRQTDSNAFYPAAPDRPLWRLFAHASLDRMISGGGSGSSPYVVVWIADDPDDLDGDPSLDSNDIMIVHSEAFGIRGGRRAVEATILRETALDGAAAGGASRSDVSVIAWREVR
jgi:type II secretory pathway pseudopilin PulG